MVQKLKNNPGFVGEGWERFKEQVKLKCPKIFGMTYEEFKNQNLTFHQLGGLGKADTQKTVHGVKIEYLVVAIIVQILFLIKLH